MKTLDQWLKGNNVVAIWDVPPRVGIHDTRAIEHVRTYLWDLSDYYVQAVQAGVLWLAPRTERTS